MIDLVDANRRKAGPGSGHGWSQCDHAEDLTVMAVGLVLSGGAPVLTFMAGALAALDEHNVKFDVISASGAGMSVSSLR